MTERIIVSLTTWSKRIENIPVVLDTIFNQTMQPDFVVLNLAHDEIIPIEIQQYIDSHNVEVNRVEDTKVYKKLIPTLKKYPNDCVISIDDDWLYPKEMIADFENIHKRHPDYPISGNNISIGGIQCHCGCASMTKAVFMGRYLDLIDQEVIDHCPSDDIVYTFVSNKAGHPYIRTEGLYYTNLESYNETEPYSLNAVGRARISNSFTYLTKKFGKIENPFSPLIHDPYFAELIYGIFESSLQDQSRVTRQETISEIHHSASYRLGHLLIRPGSVFKRFFTEKKSNK